MSQLALCFIADSLLRKNYLHINMNDDAHKIHRISKQSAGIGTQCALFCEFTNDKIILI